MWSTLHDCLKDYFHLPCDCGYQEHRLLFGSLLISAAHCSTHTITYLVVNVVAISFHLPFPNFCNPRRKSFFSTSVHVPVLNLTRRRRILVAAIRLVMVRKKCREKWNKNIGSRWTKTESRLTYRVSFLGLDWYCHFKCSLPVFHGRSSDYFCTIHRIDECCRITRGVSVTRSMGMTNRRNQKTNQS